MEHAELVPCHWKQGGYLRTGCEQPFSLLSLEFLSIVQHALLSRGSGRMRSYSTRMHLISDGGFPVEHLIYTSIHSL